MADISEKEDPVFVLDLSPKKAILAMGSPTTIITDGHEQPSSLSLPATALQRHERKVDTLSSTVAAFVVALMGTFAVVAFATPMSMTVAVAPTHKDSKTPYHVELEEEMLRWTIWESWDAYGPYPHATHPPAYLTIHSARTDKDQAEAETPPDIHNHGILLAALTAALLVACLEAEGPLATVLVVLLVAAASVALGAWAPLIAASVCAPEEGRPRYRTVTTRVRPRHGLVEVAFVTFFGLAMLHHSQIAAAGHWYLEQLPLGGSPTGLALDFLVL